MSYTQAAWYICDICHTSVEVEIDAENPEGWSKVGTRDVCDSCSDMISRAIRSMMWRADSHYEEGQLVVYDGLVYKSLIDHVSTAANQPGDVSVWAEA